MLVDLLKDEYTEVDVCGPTLPALKALLDVQAGGLNAATVPKYGKLAHGLLSACLQHIDEMRYIPRKICSGFRLISLQGP